MSHSAYPLVVHPSRVHRAQDNGSGVSRGAVPAKPCPPASPSWALRAGGGQPLVQGVPGRGPQHSPKSLEHICSIMPSALCSISHWVQILDTAVRDQPLSQLPAADACHPCQLHRDMLGEPQQPLCSVGSCVGVVPGAQMTSLASVPAHPQEGWGIGTSRPAADALGHCGSSSQGGPSPKGVTALILTLGCLWVMCPSPA